MELMRRRDLIGTNADWRNRYQEVEYIEGTGTQYINTKIPISLISALTTVWSVRLKITSNEKTIIPVGINGDNKQIVFLTNEKYRLDWCIASGQGPRTSTMPIDTVHTIEQRDGNLIINNESRKIDSASSLSISLGLFARLNKDGIPEASTISSMKLYSFIASSDGVDIDIANIIPCYRKSDGKIGMYDLVRKTFFTNAGTGEFLKGADV